MYKRQFGYLVVLLVLCVVDFRQASATEVSKMKNQNRRDWKNNQRLANRRSCCRGK